jgi:hypothetical protein
MLASLCRLKTSSTRTLVCAWPVQMDPKFLRNQRYAKKHNKKAGDA